MVNAMTQPSHVGERRVFKAIDGRKVHRTIKDEIIRRQETSRHEKLIYLQKMWYEEERRVEYRFTYFMRGFKKGARGRWVFGQYSLLIPPEDLKWLLGEARRRRWPGF
jgi:hypothetical protein